MAKFDLVRRAVTIAVGQSAGSFGELLAGVLLVRLLAPQDWTTLALALTIYGTAIGIGGLNVQDGIYFFYPRVDGARRRGLALQTMAVLLASGAVIAGILTLLGPWLGAKGHQIQPLIPWICAAVVLELPTSCAPQLLVSAERPTLASLFGTAMSVSKLALMALPLLLGMPVVAAAQGLVVHALLRVVLSAVLLPRVLPGGRWTIEWPFLKEQLVYTAPLTLSIGSAVLNKYVDKWIVATFIPGDFGVYAVAAMEIPFVPLLGFALGTVLATRISYAFQMGQRDRALAYWLAATTRGALIIGPLSVGLILCAPEVFSALFAPTYASGVLPFQIFNLILLHRVMAYGIVLRAAGDTRSLWFASLLLLAMNAVFGIPLTYWLGLPGAALGTLLAYALNLVFYLSCIGRAMHTPLSGVFPWRRYGQILLLTALAAALAWFAGSAVTGAELRLGIKAAVFVSAYLVMARLFRLGSRLPPVPEDEGPFLENVGPDPAGAADPSLVRRAA